MEIINLIEEMEKTIEKSFHVPLTGNIFINGDLLLDYLDHLRARLPDEIRQAKWINQEKERLLDEAKQKAQQIVEEAFKKTETMVDEHELTYRAKVNAGEIIAKTRNAAEEIKAGAQEYADRILNQLEKSLEKLLAEVYQNRQELQAFNLKENTEMKTVNGAPLQPGNFKAAEKGNNGRPSPSRQEIKR